MDEVTGRIEIQRSPAEVFAFLADTRNMPRYLPTVRHVVPQGDGRVAVEGETDGHPYRDEGWFQAEPETRRLRWGTGDGSRYRGELEVRERAGRAELALRLHLAPHGGHARRLQDGAGSIGHGARLAVERCLGSIKAACEEGGMEPAGKDTTRSADDIRDSRPFGSSATLNPDI